MLIFSIIPAFVIAQSGGINGTVTDEKGSLLPGIAIVLEGGRTGTVTDSAGRYALDNLREGNYELSVTGIGYKLQTKEAEVEAGQTLELDFVMEENIYELGDVVVTGKSQSEELRETGFSVEVIETRAQKNLTADVNQVLRSTSGIHIRETGGLGSGFTLSLNGLSGNQIRYFIDGIPMENFGSSLTLNNYPVNLIEKIEVYKGVVPVALGADALGGAVNISSAFAQKSFLDATYSYGSFNTHRASLNGQYADQDRGYFLKLTSFFNHSDNNYRMEEAPVFDLELGNSLGTIRTRRFHDHYTSGMINVEAGLFNKKFADKWSVAFTNTANRRNYQHPDNNILRVFGGFHTRNQTLLASTTYRKTFNKLKVKGFVLGGRIRESVIDTSSRKYNWAGDYIVRSADDPKGELFERRSLLELTDQVLRSNAGLDYAFSESHELSINFSQNYLVRTGEDEVDPFNQSFESPNYIHKNILGIAYTFQTADEKLKTTAFGKEYWYSGKIITRDFENNEVVTTPGFNYTGYGFAASYHFSEALQLKSSFEKTYRIPESYEILGDGIYVNPNPALQPEKSYNANIGTRFGQRLDKVELKSELNLFYRSSADFIRFNPLGPFGEYENLNNVRTEGVEGSVDINYNDFLSLAANITYQNLTDRTEFDEGLPNTNYKSRIPNIPYLFGNARIGISPFPKAAPNKLTLYWNTRYVHEFFFTWENLGNAKDKNTIPRQLMHDLQAEYAIEDGKYNLSLSVNNITDALVYDNFNIQKPGRAIYLKMRYFINY